MQVLEGKMLKNIFYLSLVQISNYVFPLITLPYLVRVLGAEKYGSLMLCQALIQYFLILTDYGFNLSATKKIAIAKSQDEIDKIYSNTTYAKIFLAIASLCFLIIALSSLSMFNNLHMVSFILFSSVVGNCLFPLFLFQGLEKMRDITWISILAKCVMLVSTFLLVKGSDDITGAAAAIAFAMLIPGVIATFYVRYYHLARFKKTSVRDIICELKHGSSLFLSQVAISFYTTFNTILLGHYYTPTMVGYYSAADRLRAATQSCFVPVQQVVYPRINKSGKSFSKIKHDVITYGRYFIPLVLILSCCIFLFGDKLALIYLGKEYMISATLFKWMSLLVLMVSLAIVIGQWGLISLGKEKILTNIYIGGAILHCTYSIPLVKLYSVYGMLISVIVTEAFITILMLIFFILITKNNQGLKYV